jgi:hypothetical protein
MEPSTFSRAYLQELPELAKREELDIHVKNWSHMAITAAKNGMSSYMYDPTLLLEHLGRYAQQAYSSPFGGPPYLRRQHLPK